MFLRLVIAATIGFTAAAVLAADAEWGRPEDPAVQEMIGAERLWLEANCGPRPALATYFAEAFQGTATDGRRYGREDALIPGSDHDCRLGEVRIRFFGDRAAVSYGTESSVRLRDDGSEWRRCLAWTDTWLKLDERWQIVAAQDNVVDCE